MQIALSLYTISSAGAMDSVDTLMSTYSADRNKQLGYPIVSVSTSCASDMTAQRGGESGKSPFDSSGKQNLARRVSTS